MKSKIFYYLATGTDDVKDLMENTESLHNSLKELKSNKFDLKNVFKLHIFRAFCWEVIRLTNLIFSSLRRTLFEDMEINGYFIPKGTNVMAILSAMNRDLSRI